MSAVSVTGYSTAERIGEVLKRALPLLGPEARAQIEKLLDPGTLWTIAAVLTAWIVSHAFGVGEIVDVIIVGLGVLAIGLSVFEGIDALYMFARLAINARSYQELDESAKYFARAVAILGVQAVLAVLFRGAPKTFSGGRMNVGEPPSFVTGPISRPPLVSSRMFRAGEAETDAWGKISISRFGTARDRRLAAIHESIHRLLTPKLNILRKFRVSGRMASYDRSALSTFLEEALAETAARVGVDGIREGFRGVWFPVRNGYVTLMRRASVAGETRRPFLPELGGLLAGGFIFGGVRYEIWCSPRPPKPAPGQE